MPIRLAFYGRLSTDDRQDVTLARPSQYEACERKATKELDGTIVCEFFDQVTGARDDRPEWSALVAEAGERTSRRFDGVVVYNTSRLSRDRVSAGLFERELRKHGVVVHYAIGAGDASTPEGALLISLQQSFDEYERSKLRRETRRGMRQNTLNGFRNGGRPPYGYMLLHVPHPVAVRARAGDHKSLLAVDPEQAPIVVEIFTWWAIKGWGTARIADELNRRGVLSPSHTDVKRNVKRHWSKSTIRSILGNHVYTGKTIWDRLDYATAREAGSGSPRRREQDEWTVAEVAHEALVSDEIFAAAQERLHTKLRPNGASRKGGRAFLFTGMVKCASGHAPLAMFGAEMTGRTYMRCDYGRQYGKEAAAQIEGHGTWCSVREDVLLPLALRFFEERVFGPMRMDLLAQQLDAHGKRSRIEAQEAQARPNRQIADLDKAIAFQVQAIEKGIEPELVAERIAELRADKEQAEAALRELAPEVPASHADLSAALEQLPDLSEQLRDATPEVQRAIFDAFDLRIEYDKTQQRVQISATVTEAVAEAFRGATDISPTGEFRTEGYGGGRIRTCEG
jgi:site-specific DNA recombinase